jgi:putative MFS transporter
MSNRQTRMTVIVAALGYFVDIYDLQLFNIVSKASLVGIGITDPAEIEKYDYLLFLWQMAGMLVGGLIWGWLGDTRGRKKILFGSIILYSLANIANAFVTNVEMYSTVRFIAGLGLAGELGAAITLVSEIMDKEKRGYGTMVIVTMGALGAIAAVYFSRLTFGFSPFQSWQNAYLMGGILGLLLLTLRLGTFESTIFHQHSQSTKRGNFFHLFQNKERTIRYLSCIAVGIPVWYSVGILIKFSKHFSEHSHTQTAIDIPTAIVFTYLGLSIGDLLSSLISQWLRSRKKTILIYLVCAVIFTVTFLFGQNWNANTFYLLCFLIGIGTGYWALFVSMSAELFGTNVRALVASTTPNFVRGATVPLVLSFKFLEARWGIIEAAVLLAIISFGLAFWGLKNLKESFGKDLNFIE